MYLRNKFAVPSQNEYATTLTRELMKSFVQHSYLPETTLNDLGTTFTSELMSELTALLEACIVRAPTNNWCRSNTWTTQENSET